MYNMRTRVKASLCSSDLGRVKELILGGGGGGGRKERVGCNVGEDVFNRRPTLRRRSDFSQWPLMVLQPNTPKRLSHRLQYKNKLL